ncbi:MAG: class I SAM-dependent methyltransferase [Alphaproteobacteria bacterium]|nr:class I SAM-dependent methyltransferase [Alphaproteobacteria bacterium]
MPAGPPSAAEIRALGINARLADWIALHRKDAVSAAVPLPPPDLMRRMTGLATAADFVRGGTEMLAALAKASPLPPAEFKNILDFGAGCGWLARFFKGYRGHYVGVDSDIGAVAWIKAALPWVEGHLVAPRGRIPFAPGNFEGVLAATAFTRMDARDYTAALNELARVTEPAGTAMLGLLGPQALGRAERDADIRARLGVAEADIAKARAAMQGGGLYLARGGERPAAFVSAAFADRACRDLYEIVSYTPAAIDGLMDLLVLRRTGLPVRRGWLRL